MIKDSWDWNEDDLKGLLGQSENYRLEFKDSRILQKDNESIKNELTKEVSALANAEGGTIVIGITEKKVGKSKVADKLDGGIDEVTMNRERLQQLVEGNMSPHLPGLRFKPIYLNGTSPAKYAHVIYVPKGSNAYQASDKIYYIRSEYEAKALHDTQIRLLMSRGRTTLATIELGNKQSKMAEESFQREKESILSRAKATYPASNNFRQQSLIEKYIADETVRLKKEEFDEYLFSLEIRNIGERTIREFYLEINILFSQNLTDLSEKQKPNALWHEGQHKINFNKKTFSYSSEENSFDAKKQGKFEPENKIYPGLSRKFTSGICIVKIPEGRTLKEMEASLAWQLYYDNYPSNSGLIYLADEFRA